MACRILRFFEQMNQASISALIWSVADLLRGDYKQSEYGRVILPFTVLRRLDCVLAPTKKAVLTEFEAKTKAGLNPDPFLLRKAKQSFYNTSPLDLPTLLGDQDHIRQNLYAYIQAFSPAVRDIFERFDFHTQVERLAKANLLYLVVEKFAGIDLHPEAVDNAAMGQVFEELIRKFAEISNETAGEHFTPREVKLLENETLAQQAASNSKDQFANSPDLRRALMDAIIDTFEAHQTMSSQALGSERVRDGLTDILLGPAQLYEALRARSPSGARHPNSG